MRVLALLLLLIISSLKWKYCVASTTLLLYVSSTCEDADPQSVTGSDTGDCMRLLESFNSFRLKEIDDQCSFTVYGTDIDWCDPHANPNIELGNGCYQYNSTTIGWYSIDCEAGFGATTSPQPSATSEMSSSSKLATSPSQNSSGLDMDSIIGLAVGLPGAVVAIGTILIYSMRLRKKKHRQNRTSTSSKPKMTGLPAGIRAPTP